MISSDSFVKVKNPFNLQTYQRRLRHLQSIAVRSLSCPSDPGLDFTSLQVFFTLHTDGKSKAFYTSEKITGSLNPTWQHFDLLHFDIEDQEVDLTSKFVLVRVWMCQGLSCKVKIECHVYLTGLVFFANSLQVPGIKHPPNTFLFGLHNHYFVHYDSQVSTPQFDQWVQDQEVPSQRVPAVVSVDQSLLRPSYNLNYLSRMHTVQRAIKQTSATVKRIHSNIEDKLLCSTENTEKLSQREMLEMRVRQLRQELLWQTQRRAVEEDKLEELRAEGEDRAQRLKKGQTDMQSKIKKCEEKRTLHIQSREMLVKENAQVQYRRKQIINEMAHYIYPITEDDKNNFFIVKVRLPNAEDYQGQDEIRVSVALGFTCHLTQMMSHFMDMPLRYPMLHRGSRSLIIDHVHSKLAEKDREFPLYSKGKEKFQFNYAVFLINKNISQLRFYCGMGTPDLRQTLPNIKAFLEQRLGVRQINSTDHRGSSSLASAPSVGGSMGGSSRRSTAPSTAPSSQPRKDLASEFEATLTPVTSMRGDSDDRISLTDIDVSHNNSTPLPHSKHNSGQASAPSTLRLSEKNGHSNSARSKNGWHNKNANAEDSEGEGEDIFKPSNDNFFQMKVSPEVTAFNSVAAFPLPTDSLTTDMSPSDPVVIPMSESLSNQRTFKLVNAPATTITSPCSDKSQESSIGGVGLERHIGGEPSHANGSEGLQNSYNQSYSSLDSSEMYVASSEHKSGL